MVIVLPAPAPLRGRVLDAAGRAVPRSVVFARESPRVWDFHHGAREEGPGLWQRADADAEGRYAFASLPPGEIEVLAGRTAGAACFAGRVATTGVSEMDVKLAATSSIRGRSTGGSRTTS